MGWGKLGALHHLWKERFHQYFKNAAGFTLISLKEELCDYVRDHQTEISSGRILFLVDYCFVSSNVNGIDFIIQNEIKDKAMLVTNKYPDKKMQNQLIEHGIGLILKKEISKISLNTLYQQLDVILLDDQPCVTKHGCLKRSNLERKSWYLTVIKKCLIISRRLVRML